MHAHRPSVRPLWIALFVVHLISALGLLYWIFAQTQPVAMYDLHLSEGEKLKCVSYAPYHLPGQTPFDKEARVSREQISADLTALAKITDCVRLYSIDQGLDQVLGVARETGLTVLLGAWIGFDRKKNAVELDKAITLANENPDVVRALIVGNEVLLRRERSEEEMRALIREAKSKAKVPVTYADVWEFWIKHDSLAAEVDFVTVHILPFWEDEPVDIEHALAHVADIHTKVSAHFAGKSILIGETGWPSEGRQREESKPSRVNQARYIREFVHQAHARSWNYNLIEALDQPWKRRLEGTVGGYWGMLEAQTLKPKFPLAGPVSERASALAPVAGGIIGAVVSLLLAAKVRGPDNKTLRILASAAVGASGGLVTLLHWEHAVVAYRDALEWITLGSVATLSMLLPAVLARWNGDPVPSAELAWAKVRARQAVSSADLLGLTRGLLLFAAAIAALLLFVDSRYRDFPTLLYFTPAAVFGVIGWWQGPSGRAERIFAWVTMLSVIFRWLPEPSNPQAIGWLGVGLILAVPLLAARSSQDEQR